MRRIFWILGILLMSALPFQPLQANGTEKREKTNDPWERWNVRLGGSLTVLDSDVTLGAGDTGFGISINVEDALGLDSSTLVFKGDVQYRFGSTERHKLLFNLATYRRDATRHIGRDLEIGDEIIPEHTTVETTFDFDIFQAGYTYSFLQDERMDFAIGAGLYVMPIEFSLTATGAERSVFEDITAPLPVLMLTGDLAISEKWLLRLGAEVFYIEISDFTGGITNSFVAVEYNAWENVGIGLAVDFFNTKIEAKDDDAWPGVDFIGDLEFGVSGILLYLKFDW